MRNFLLLLRLNRLELFGINRLRNDPAKRARMRWMLPLAALGALVALGVAGLYCFGIAYALDMIGALDVFPPMIAAIAAVTAFVTTIFKAPDALFRTRDFDQLLSLPIPARTVALSRIAKLYGIELVFTLAVMLPGCAAYAFFARPGAMFYIAYMLSMFAVPMLPLALSSLVGVLVAFAGASVKRARYAGLILSFLATMGVLAGSMYLSARSGDGLAQLMNLALGLRDMLARIYPPTAVYQAAVVGGDVGALALYVLLSLAALLLVSALFGKFFVRLNSFLNARRATGGFVVGAQRARGATRALVMREWRRYLASNIYVLNTAMGLLLSLIGVAALVVLVPRDQIDMVLRSTGIDGPIFAVLPFLLGWFVSMAPTTGSSISLEGKTLWIVRSLPIPARRWIFAKLYLNLQMMVPVALVDAIVLAAALGIRGWALVVLVLLPVLMGTFVSLFALVINCNVFRFDWTSETKVVKQSWGTGVPVVLSMALSFGGVYLTAQVPALGHMLVPLLFTGALALGCAALWLLIGARAEEWVLKM